MSTNWIYPVAFSSLPSRRCTDEQQSPNTVNIFMLCADNRVTHGYLTSFEWVVLRTALKKDKLCQCVVSTRWCHSAHCKRVNDHCSKHVSRAPHFPFRWRAVAPSLSRSFNVWFFSLGLFEIACLYSHTPYVEWFEGSHPSEIRPIDRQSLARVMDDLEKKKRLENCIQEDGRHLTDIILKLNHLVWHVLSFNFV